MQSQGSTSWFGLSGGAGGVDGLGGRKGGGGGGDGGDGDAGGKGNKNGSPFPLQLKPSLLLEGEKEAATHFSVTGVGFSTGTREQTLRTTTAQVALRCGVRTRIAGMRHRSARFSAAATHWDVTKSHASAPVRSSTSWRDVSSTSNTPAPVLEEK